MEEWFDLSDIFEYGEEITKDDFLAKVAEKLDEYPNNVKFALDGSDSYDDGCTWIVVRRANK